MAHARKRTYNPYRDLIEALNKVGVDYVVVGMSGINFYASSPREAFSTWDYDLFLRPSLANAARALKVFREAGYETFTPEEPVSEKNLKKILGQRKTVLAANPDGITFELLFAVSGFVFRQLAEDASIFTDEGTPVRVGKLQKLLASKKAAGRPKDRAFLKRYEILLKEQGA